ncbi:UNVERIFIED_CONTAM: hypothetical protein Slati_1514100 [Sesamum latifolium]|uniref:Uncharacterized protein n=1 Tax=Sesamum latifolium TaxID=2727402 RepID=A0AAW2X5Y5_9LAMI
MPKRQRWLFLMRWATPFYLRGRLKPLTFQNPTFMRSEEGHPLPASVLVLRAIGATNSVMDGESESLEEPDEPAGECSSISAPRACKTASAPLKSVPA